MNFKNHPLKENPGYKIMMKILTVSEPFKKYLINWLIHSKTPPRIYVGEVT